MPEPKGFIDARCSCGKKIGWYGTMADRPQCLNCKSTAGKVLTETDMIAAFEKIKEILNGRLRMTAQLSPTEWEFIQNMFDQRLKRQAYTCGQIEGVNRIYERAKK